MAVRPFYLDADIEGYKTKLKGGTKRGKGSQTINIYQRDEGDITVPFVINQSIFRVQRWCPLFSHLC